MAETVYATIDAIRAKIAELRDKKLALDSGRVVGVNLGSAQKTKLAAGIGQLLIEVEQELNELKGQL